MIFKASDPRREEREVYFIEAEGTARIKIGVANCAHTRMKALDATCPVPLRLLGVVTTDRAGSLEKELHRKFSHLRDKAEWFRCDPEITDYIKASATVPKPPRFGPGGLRLRPGQARPLYAGRL